jgi:hypothetical protein
MLIYGVESQHSNLKEEPRKPRLTTIQVLLVEASHHFLRLNPLVKLLRVE